MSDIDFWARDLTQDQMKFRQDTQIYPPRCQLKVYLSHETQATSLSVQFHGCKHSSLNTELLFPLGQCVHPAVYITCMLYMFNHKGDVIPFCRNASTSATRCFFTFNSSTT